jgi:hypothetical protein
MISFELSSLENSLGSSPLTEMRVAGVESMICKFMVALLSVSRFFSVQLDFWVCTSGSMLNMAMPLSAGTFLIVADDFRLSFAEDAELAMGGRGDLMLLLSILAFLVVCCRVGGAPPPPLSFLLVVDVRFSLALLEEGFSMAAAEEPTFALSLFMDGTGVKCASLKGSVLLSPLLVCL